MPEYEVYQELARMGLTRETASREQIKEAMRRANNGRYVYPHEVDRFRFPRTEMKLPKQAGIVKLSNRSGAVQGRAAIA